MTRILALLLLIATPAVAQPRDTITIGINEFPVSLHPAIDAVLIKSYVIGYTIRTVTTYDASNHVICLLCSEVPTLENGLVRHEGEGLAVTIKLRTDLRWGDGEPVTARDLLFTWTVGRDPNAGFSNAYPWTRAKSVDLVDDHTAVMHLDKTLVSYALWDQLLPEHIEGPIFARAKNPGDYINTTEFNRNPLNPGLWNGPYMITGYASGSGITLSPNPHWPGPGPGFKTVAFRFVGDTAALLANLMSGDVDMYHNMTLDQALTLEKQQPDRFRYVYSPSLNYAHIDMAAGNPILQDIRVRRALLLAIDRATINDRLYGGRDVIATSFVSQQNPEFDPTVPVVGYDPAAARRLLDEAGWRPGPDGIRVNAKGERLSMEFLAGAGFRIIDLLQAVMQSQWKAVGVEVNLRTEPSRTLFGVTTKHRAFTGLVMYSWSSNVGESPRLILGSDMIPTEANNWSGNNNVSFSDPAFDAAVAEADAELDPVKRRAAWSVMQHIYADKLPVLPLFIAVIPQVSPKWLHGYGANGTGQPFSQQAELWHAE